MTHSRVRVTMLLLGASFLAALTLCTWHMLAPSTMWLGTFERVMSCGLFAATLFTLAAAVAKPRWLCVVVPSLALATNAVFMMCAAVGHPIFRVAHPVDRRYAVTLAFALLVNVAGLLARRWWARWVALAFGAVAICSGGLNAFNFWAVGASQNLAYPEWYVTACRFEWLQLLTAFSGALIILNLANSGEAFATPAQWQSKHRLMRWLRATTMASVAAVPMLLVYAWSQPLVAATATTAVIVAVILTLGVVLTIRSKALGAMLLGLGGIGLFAQTVGTFVLAPQRSVAAYYVVFWLPAALCALICAAMLITPMLRLLHSPQQR